MATHLSRRSRFWSALLLAAVTCIAIQPDADARSSGGYSRPGGFSRTPSFSRGGGGFRTPSFSGGYRRAAPSMPRQRYVAPASPGDRSFSEGRSGAAFDAFRRQGSAGPQPNRTPAPAASAPYGGFRGAPAPIGGFRGAPARQGWFADRGWSVPSYIGGGRQFGIWDGLFLWTLLNNLSRPGAGDFFHNNQNDPGYREWRADADRQAQNDPALRQKLNDLDQQLAQKQGQPRDPGALPAGVPAQVAEAPPQRTPGFPAQNPVTVWLVVLGGAGGLGYLAWRRHRPVAGGSAMTAPPANAFETVGSLLRHKLSGQPYTPDKFRVGMTMALDPTPFILAGGAIKVPQPQGTGSGQISVSAIGHVTSGDARLLRLYLLDDRFLVQLHLNQAGDPDESRLFGTIDAVTPADPNEWGAWLDPNEGMIGWPAFQTKDGKTYDRAWVPGGGRISPRAISETIESLSGTRTIQSQAMLYAAATGVAPPAPATEYIMVAAVRDGGRAWVEIRAGIDINPVTLQLA